MFVGNLRRTKVLEIYIISQLWILQSNPLFSEGGNKAIMIQGILEAERKGLGISINKESPEFTKRYSEAELVVSAPCFVGQFFGSVVAGACTKSSPLSDSAAPLPAGSLRIQAY